jgi:hypothetical protein
MNDRNFFLPALQGFAILPEGGVKLISECIEAELSLPVSVLMGANLANEVRCNICFGQLQY